MKLSISISPKNQSDEQSPSPQTSGKQLNSLGKVTLRLDLNEPWQPNTRRNGKPPATVEEVRYKYTYDPETGNLYYNYNSGNRKAGDQVGYVGGPGYRMTTLNRKQVCIHQIIWFMMAGSWPTEDVDHKNLNKLDNSWKNLRHGSHSANCYNNPASRKKDYGVYWSKAKGKWRVATWENGAYKHHGYFINKDEAIQVAQRVISCRQV